VGKIKKIRNWGTLIRETYGNIIFAIGSFTDSATRILKKQNYRRYVEGMEN